jgi:beta-glucuronidase
MTFNGVDRRQFLQATGAAAVLLAANDLGISQDAPVETSDTTGFSGLALYPQTNPYRQVISLDGFWDFQTDPQNVGVTKEWFRGLPAGSPIAVPASWNDQFEELRDYCGIAWYQTQFDLPAGFATERRVRLRFGSVNYIAEVWLNGTPLGKHEGGHLPFEFDLNGKLRPEHNVLVVRVDGALAPDRVPPGNIPPDPKNTFSNRQYPDTSFDFFPFAGIHRPVMLYSTPVQAIADLTVLTTIHGAEGRVCVQFTTAPGTTGTIRFTLEGHGAKVTVEAPVSGERGQVELAVPNAALWEPGQPNLYHLKVEVVRSGAVADRYSMKIGIRTIEVDGDRLLLNGKPVFLKGFGRHEDFPVAGRGYVAPVIIRDYSIMRWIGANSFRTSHYPYSEQMMAMADELGFLVIDEIPAVGLFFAEDGLQRRLDLCRQYIRELISRDRNHPSVIMWSVANEPHSGRPAAKEFFRTLYRTAKSQDESRPVTLVNVAGVWEESFEFLDVVCVNRYNGWYEEQGRLEEGVALLSVELDKIHAAFKKPMIVTEFGADALPGHHAEPPEMFSEEYQAKMITLYHALFKTKSYIVGEHVWNLCDFKTSQAVHRPGALNHKGVFTRDRRPKLAAHTLRELWRS